MFRVKTSLIWKEKSKTFSVFLRLPDRASVVRDTWLKAHSDKEVYDELEEKKKTKTKGKIKFEKL